VGSACGGRPIQGEMLPSGDRAILHGRWLRKIITQNSRGIDDLLSRDPKVNRRPTPPPPPRPPALYFCSLLRRGRCRQWARAEPMIPALGLTAAIFAQRLGQPIRALEATRFNPALTMYGGDDVGPCSSADRAKARLIPGGRLANPNGAVGIPATRKKSGSSRFRSVFTSRWFAFPMADGRGLDGRKKVLKAGCGSIRSSHCRLTALGRMPRRLAAARQDRRP